MPIFSRIITSQTAMPLAAATAVMLVDKSDRCRETACTLARDLVSLVPETEALLVGPIANVMLDEDNSIRADACNAAQSFTRRSVNKFAVHLCEVIPDDCRSMTERMAACASAGDIAVISPTAAEIIVLALAKTMESDKQSGIRWAACCSTRHILMHGPEAARDTLLPALEKAKNDPHKEVRDLAREPLSMTGQFNASGAGPVSRELVNSTGPKLIRPECC